MANPLQPKESLPAADLDPKDLQVIFDNIDDSLAFWQVLYNDAVRSQDDGLPVSLAQISAASDWLKMSSAPLYPSLGARGMRAIAYRLLNLVVKTFGSPQIQFNRKQRDFLSEMQIVLQAFNTQALVLKSTIEENRARIRALEAENSDCRQDIETLTSQLAELRLDLDRLVNQPSSKNRV